MDLSGSAVSAPSITVAVSHPRGQGSCVAGAAVFVAALAVPLDDVTLLLALMLALRGRQLVVDSRPSVER